MIKCDHCTVVQHLHSMGKVQKSGVCVLHALSKNYKNQRVAICAPLLARHRLAREQHRTFLSCIVFGDEKLCLYANISKRKEWLNPNKRRICRESSNFCTWDYYLPFTVSTHYLQMTKLLYVNSCTTIELQIKNDCR